MNHAQFWGGGGAAPYQIEQSLRFNGSDSAYLINSTPSTDGNRKTYTISVWVKKVVNSGTGGDTFFYAKADSNNGFTSLSFGNADAGHNESLRLLVSDSGASQYKVRESSTAAYRDYSAWMHVVAVMDTTQSTAADRAKIYVNGEQVTDLAPAYTEPAQDYQNYVNGNNAKVQIGRNFNEVGQGPWYFDGYLAEYHLVDGTALEPTDFGEPDDNGVWRPIRYTGSYGTNGFYLKFDPSATNGIGHDHSGNGNNFTASGFTTSGTGTDVMSDTPTTNYATLNPLAVTGSVATLSDGNLQAVTPVSGAGNTFATMQIPSSGKWYWECKGTAANTGFTAFFGVSRYNSSDSNIWQNSNHAFYYSSGDKYVDGADSSYGSAYALNDLIGVACDADAETIEFYKNGTSQGSISHTMVDMFPAACDGSNANGTTFVFNFGQRAFEQTPPTGFSALNTANLPAPDIADGSKNFNTVLWSGDGTDGRSITGLGFKPDFVWIKNRDDGTRSHLLYDVVRPISTQLSSNATSAEVYVADRFDSFDSDGFTGGNLINTNTEKFVAWNWKAGGSVSADNNTDGTITSTVSANPSAGFSIVSYTGTSSSATVGHSLGVAPNMILFKNRDQPDKWAVYHSAIGATKFLSLNETTAATTSSAYFADTEPTSSVFTVNQTGPVNQTGEKYVAYCFAEVEGYSKFGSYTGNASTDGVFVYCGFKPAWIMFKRTGNTSNWSVFDTARGTYNSNTPELQANNSTSETAISDRFDILSNGFKFRSSVFPNDATAKIFVAFAENPFGGSGVSPATAR